jgi:hypothetical protein
MRYSRNSQDRWIEWEGEGFAEQDDESPIYYTIGRVYPAEDGTRELLARKLQRDGLADNLWGGFVLVDNNITVTYGYVDEPSEGDFVFYDPYDEDIPLTAQEATFVEVTLGD